MNNKTTSRIATTIDNTLPIKLYHHSFLFRSYCYLNFHVVKAKFGLTTIFFFSRAKPFFRQLDAFYVPFLDKAIFSECVTTDYGSRGHDFNLRYFDIWYGWCNSRNKKKMIPKLKNNTD